MKILSVLCIILSCMCITSVYAQNMRNIALGCKVTFDPAPNDSGCTDSNDAIQLTDGEFAGNGFWTDIKAVGWAAASPFHIIVDLGDIKPISGFMFSTAARANADVLWPVSLIVQVSDDGVNYHYVCDLAVKERMKGDLPVPSDIDIRHQFKADDVKTHGRYVCISALAKCPYVFVDEIEVYQGEESFLKLPLSGNASKDYRAYAQNSVHKSAVVERLTLDIDAINKKINTSYLNAENQYDLLDKLTKLSDQVESIPAETPANFKAILPLNDLERSIFAVNGLVLKKMGYRPLTVWKKHRYDRLDVFENPAKSSATLSIDALKNEFRADSFLLTNASDKHMLVQLKINLSPKILDRNWIKVSEIPWTDTASRLPVASALPDIEPEDGAYSVSVPAGMTRKIWFTIDTSYLQSGNYKGSVSVKSSAGTSNIPFNIRVSKLKMPRPRLHLGVWDHTNSDYNRAMTPENIPAAIKLMRSHFTDVPWTETDGLPLVENPTPESFRIFDRWIKRWPDASYYMVFLNVSDTFGGAKIGSEDFAQKVGKWAKSIEKHLKEQKIDPRKLGILLVDEPRSEKQDEIIVAWIKAIRAAAVKFTFFEDPIWENPQNNKIQEAITLPDILSPNLAIYYRTGREAQEYWENIRKSGRQLWFYLCSGPVRTFDPTLYYRMMAWHAYKAGAVGIGFWSFGDLGGGKSSWNEYEIRLNAYAPAFIDPSGVTDSVHWQAVREGIEDYEYLCMLGDSIKKSKNARLKAEAQKVLTDAVQQITSKYRQDYNWKSDETHLLVDKARIRILNMLEKM